MRMTVLTPAGLILLLAGCYTYVDHTRSLDFYDLKPPPTTQQVAAFRQLFPDTPVTTTQPGSYNKLELGMTRAMVDALAGDHFTAGPRLAPYTRADKSRDGLRIDVELYFHPGGSDSAQDILFFMKTHWTGIYFMRSTDWP
jgi:hypothetical protein